MDIVQFFFVLLISAAEALNTRQGNRIRMVEIALADEDKTWLTQMDA